MIEKSFQKKNQVDNKKGSRAYIFINICYNKNY